MNYNVDVVLHIPFSMKNVDAASNFEAVEKSKNLIYSAFPILIHEHLQEIKDEMVIELCDVKESK